MTKVSQTELIIGAIAGKIVCFPTDTVPALAVLPDSAQKIFALKQRPLHKPLILMGAKSEDLWKFVTGSPKEMGVWQQIAAQYWPGALTLILPASAQVNQKMNPSDPTTIGVRIPNHPAAQAILTQTGPLATTSANLSGEPPLETLTEIDLRFPHILTLDYGEENEKFGSGFPSTVAKWNLDGWKILRQGFIQNLDLLS